MKKKKSRKVLSVVIVFVVILAMVLPFVQKTEVYADPGTDAEGQISEIVTEGEPEEYFVPEEIGEEEQIPEEYPVSEATASEPQIAEENTEAMEPVEESDATDDSYVQEEVGEETPDIFRKEKELDGVLIKIEAEEGTFPVDAELKAEAADIKAEKEAEEAVDKVRPAHLNVADSYTFDIKVVDKDGNELQPSSGKKVKVSFETDHAKDQNLDATIYHIAEVEKKDSKTKKAEVVFEAEKLDSDMDIKESTVSAETEGFSLYTVEFTYGDLTYVHDNTDNNTDTVSLEMIAEKTGLTGTAFSASADTADADYLTIDNTAKTVTFLKTFTDAKVLTVTLNSGTAESPILTEYDINVKNDNGDNVVAWVAAQRANPNPAVVWRITKDGDYYKLQNLYTGKYAGVAAYSRVSWTDECEKTQKFMTSNVAGAFEISNSDQNYRWGIGGSYHVANYGYVGSVGGTDQRNAWKVYELSDAQVQVMCDNMASELNAASSAFGYVNVMKDEASKDAAQALLAGNPTYEEMREAFKNVMPLTDGYYRLSYPKNYAGVLGEPYVFFGNDKLLNSNLSLDDAKADYSTVYKLTVEGNVTVPAGPGYVVTMESQGGLRPYYNGGYGDHKALDGNSAKARLIRPTGGFDDGGRTAFAIEVSQASGSFHNNYYLIKTADGTDNPVKAYYAGSSAVRLATSAQGYLYPATDITVKLNQAGDNYWATLYLPFGVTLPTGTEAYVGVVEDDKLKLTSIGQDIPAETPVVLCGDAATITATINDEIPEYTGTIGLSGQYLAADSRDDNIRSLGVKDGVVGFYKLPDSSTGLGANKALLNTGSGSQGYKIVIDDDVTAVNTAIINGQSSMVNDYYDLQGRKVAAPQKGSLYIKDGKVVKF